MLQNLRVKRKILISADKVSCIQNTFSGKSDVRRDMVHLQKQKSKGVGEQFQKG